MAREKPVYVLVPVETVSKRKPGRPVQMEVDGVSVERLCAGDVPARVTTSERREAVRRLTAVGLSARAIAVRVGVSERQVQRDRSPRRSEARAWWLEVADPSMRRHFNVSCPGPDCPYCRATRRRRERKLASLAAKPPALIPSGCSVAGHGAVQAPDGTSVPSAERPALPSTVGGPQ